MLLDFGVSVAVTVAVVELFKRTFDVPERYKPALAVSAGMVIAILGTTLNIFSVEIFRGIFLNGLMIGLTAAGLYDQKAIVSK